MRQMVSDRPCEIAKIGDRHAVKFCPMIKGAKNPDRALFSRQKDAKEFTVSVTYHDTRGCQWYLPKPVMDRRGCPSRITYRIVRGKIEVTAARN